jgi:uroporphyrinogen decarboxylase
MRQAGRALPEYRAIRGDGSLLDAVRQPEVAAEITLQPVRRYGVDAAVLFSDIMVPLVAIGFGVDIRPGVGPVAWPPFRGEEDLRRLRSFIPSEDAPWVAETIRILAGELDVPLIGFAGGPFTLASYLIEGQASRDYSRTKALMFSSPGLWNTLIDRLSDLVIASLKDQVEAGAKAVQLFDSWVGALSIDNYRTFVLPCVKRIFASLEELGVPRIHFGVGTGHLLDALDEAGAEVLGLDWRTTFKEAALAAPSPRAFQGNLDPAVCLAPWSIVRSEAQRILAERPEDRGMIFNLGHGVLPETNPEVLTKLVEFVHGSTELG